MFVKKDKKDVVVAVVDDTNSHGGHHETVHKPYQWSSEENKWDENNHHHHHHNHHDHSVETVYLQSTDDGHKPNRFFQFFGDIGSKFTSVFKRKGSDEKKPVYHVNVPHSSGSSEEYNHHHYHPTTYVSPAWYSSEEEDDRWHMHPQKKHKKTSSGSKYEVPLYYESNSGSDEHHKYRPSKKHHYDFDSQYYEEQRNLHSDLKSEAIDDSLNEKESYATMLLKNGEDETDQAAVPVQIAVPMKGSEEMRPEKEEKPARPVKPAKPTENQEKEKEKVKPIRIKRPYNFISVHDVRFDKCGRLWFIDVGTAEYSTNPIFYHNPILWAFEVKLNSKGKMMSRPYLRHEMEDSTPTGLRSLVVDIHDDCDDFHVYMANSKDSRIVVYSSAKDSHWQFEHPSLAPVLKETEAKVQDYSYKFKAGVYSLSLGARDEEGYRDVYFTPGSGTGQFKVNTDLLQHRKAAPNRFNPKLFKFLGYRGEEGLTRAQVYDPRTEVLFSTSVEYSNVNCWNTHKLLTPDNFATAYSHKDMVFGSDIKVG